MRRGAAESPPIAPCRCRADWEALCCHVDQGSYFRPTNGFVHWLGKFVGRHWTTHSRMTRLQLYRDTLWLGSRSDIQAVNTTSRNCFGEEATGTKLVQRLFNSSEAIGTIDWDSDRLRHAIEVVRE